MENVHLSSVQNIVSLLKELNCNVLGNSSDQWIYELLFKPGPQRVELIEWILTKLEFSLPAATVQPFEERMKALQSFIISCGICSDVNVIKGESSSRKQILFWKLLTDILHTKCSLRPQVTVSEFSEDEAFHSYENSEWDCHSQLREMTDIQSICVNNIIQSGCMKQIKEEVRLFPPCLLKECDQLSRETLQKFEIPDLDELKQLSKVKFATEENKVSKVVNDKQFPFHQYKFDSILPYEDVKLLHEKSNKTLKDLHSCAVGPFNDTHNSLKALTSHVTCDPFVDVGPEFKSAELHFDSVLKLEKSILTLKSSATKIEEALREAASLKPSTELLSNSQLKEFIDIMKSDE